ncbi:MAG TPA: response regulator [bacterium]
MSARATILLVDDEPSIVKVVGKRLELDGYRVVTARDGEEALREFRASSPQLVILDLMLPKINGYEVCRRLKEDEATRGIPVLLFSAKAHEKDRALGMQSGADEYLTKPFKAETLLERVRGLLAGEGSGTQEA